MWARRALILVLSALLSVLCASEPRQWSVSGSQDVDSRNGRVSSGRKYWWKSFYRGVHSDSDGYASSLDEEFDEGDDAIGDLPPEEPRPDSVAICALMKGESWANVKEWIEFHRWIGVDKMFLMENGNECAIKYNLQPYIDAGVVQLEVDPTPVVPLQNIWYNECAKKAAANYAWVAFIDMDEFIVVLDKLGSTVLYADGATMPTYPARTGPTGEGPKGLTYDSHVYKDDYESERKDVLTKNHKIVIFHYVIRSLDQITAKAHRYSGKIGIRFGELLKDHPKKSGSELLAILEGEYGFDGDSNICREGARLHSAIEYAQTQGWSPINTKEYYFR